MRLLLQNQLVITLKLPKKHKRLFKVKSKGSKYGFGAKLYTHVFDDAAIVVNPLGIRYRNKHYRTLQEAQDEVHENMMKRLYGVEHPQVYKFNQFIDDYRYLSYTAFEEKYPWYNTKRETFRHALNDSDKISEVCLDMELFGSMAGQINRGEMIEELR